MRIQDKRSDIDFLQRRARLGPHDERMDDRIRELQMEAKTDERKLDDELKHKFRFITGHNKAESSPGVFAEELKVKKNIR